MTPTTDNNNKNRNYASPQKTQQSIVTYTNQKQTKKLNSNHTPPRPKSAIKGAALAITGRQSPPAWDKRPELSNNTYHSLQSLAEEEEEDPQTMIETNQKPQEDNDFCAKEDGTEEDSTATPDTPDQQNLISSTEKVLLSRKAQQALRKLRSARKD